MESYLNRYWIEAFDVSFVGTFFILTFFVPFKLRLKFKLWKGKNYEVLFTKLTLDVEQAWAHPSLFPDPVIYSTNLNENKLLKAVKESYLNRYWIEPCNSSFVGTFFHSHFFRSIKATSFKMQIVNAQFSWPESQVSWRVWHAKWWNL